MIELDHVQKVIGPTTVVDIESLTVAAGEVAALVGPVGSGKSAVLALLTGQATPTVGTVRVAGLNPAQERDQLSRHIGVLFADNGLYERLTAKANLTFFCQLHGLRATRAEEVLAQVGLSDHAIMPVSRLPRGLARRLAVGRAILHQPEVLLLMEPFAGCDASSTALLSRLIRRLASAGTAVLILAREGLGLGDLCQVAYALEQGRVVDSFTPQGSAQTDLPFKIPAHLEGQVALLNPADVLYASVEGDHTYLHTAEGQFPSHLTLAELEQRLAQRGFFRAHRGYLVNLQHVRSVIPYTRDSFTLILDDAANTEIPLSKAAARDLRDLVGY